ncbi:MAG: geranylgeranylglyceryl/heptaprenylglyceryl phosphate synthase [bacterium]|nr:geranylgeranylglyceryl/heptaprenylglyceryl phosphate synthase [bacterium]
MKGISTYQYLLDYRKNVGPGLFVLLDPDRKSISELLETATTAEQNGAAALLFGTSFLSGNTFHESLQAIRSTVTIPLLLFPGNSSQVTKNVDAILLLSLLSSRNPQFLIGEHVIAAPMIKHLQVEVISVAYLLIESGKITTAEFVSGSLPIPRDKPELAVAHALAGEQLGFKLVYLEAGSGAKHPVPSEMIRSVKNELTIPLIVGGGIRSEDGIRTAVQSGADFVVVGTHFEQFGVSQLRDFVAALNG